MKFEWDENKNVVNFNKHGVLFEEAKTVWSDPQSIEYFDPDSSHSEDRYIRIGYSIKSRILLVVFCERDYENIVRIISARKTTSNERKQFEKRV